MPHYVVIITHPSGQRRTHRQEAPSMQSAVVDALSEGQALGDSSQSRVTYAQEFDPELLGGCPFENWGVRCTLLDGHPGDHVPPADAFGKLP